MQSKKATSNVCTYNSSEKKKSWRKKEAKGEGKMLLYYYVPTCWSAFSCGNCMSLKSASSSSLEDMALA